MKSKLPEYSDNTQGVEGWLELKGAEQGFNKDHRIPGTAHKYQCKAGFQLDDGTGEADGTNPEQILACQGSRKVDFSGITKKCVRKYPCVAKQAF